MASPSTSHALTEVEQVTVLKEVLDDEILSNYSSDDESASDYDYTQLVPPQTISDSERDSDPEDIMAQDGLEEVSRRFVWEDIDSFHASRESFCGVCGPQFDTAELDVVSVFESIFDISLVQLIVDETNKYAQQKISKIARPLTFRSRIRKWEDVTLDEMYVVLALIMLTGIDQRPTLRSYYSKNRLLFTPFFAETLPLERLEVIMRFLHFSDNSKQNEYQGPSKLFKIYPVIQHLSRKFQILYLPGQNIAIDESLTLWKGRLSFKQYLPLKAAKFGIKTFELCESSSGYVWSFLVYTGQGMELTNQYVTAEKNKTTAIVVTLLENLLGRGYTVWMDNFYNSPDLARFLKSKNTDCVGTLHTNRKNVPPLVKNKKLEKGEHCAQHSGDVAVLAWQDKRRVTMISTYHKNDMRVVVNRANKPEIKPVVVCDYNRNMLGVDLKDQMLQPYLLERKKGTKWYLKLFKRLLNVAIHNSMVIYRSHPNKQNLDTLQFRLSLVQGLVEKHGSGIIQY
ncbi:piggyBac transposable element-derived protein 4 [Cryptotermes secundus]|uniref:piggyBac transposable element-derived protein 4 n=1 Tax=Cryptotermes secundus TaxID=105785 RepID=UPI000CD7BCB8|nr:piggyBac transposable element-derived protein 4 [Cryptotermes secundus]